MIVNFKKMGSKNVVGPPEYNAKRCVGQCTFPLTHADNPSKYANVQVSHKPFPECTALPKTLSQKETRCQPRDDSRE